MKKGDPIVVTTAHRGVFFGYFDSQDGDTVTLTKARNCLYWSRQTRGFIGLATNGPMDGSRVGPAADEVRLYSVTAILKPTKEAVENWEKGEWS